jgi:RNA polymerase sigma-70 factor (ECF subfamily)
MEIARVVPANPPLASTEAVDFEAEVLAVYPALVRRLTLILRDSAEAEDVAQSTVARAFDRRARFTGGDVRAWLYTIGLRLAFNELRRRRRSPAVQLQGPDGRDADRGASPAPEWAMATDPDLWQALAEVGERQRAALLLSVLEGYTHVEIGRMLDVRAGTVSSWLSRTKAQLRERLGDDR